MPIRVLIADPDKSLLESYQSYLARRGFEVIAATSGRECIAYLRERKPDALVLEPELPWGQEQEVVAMMQEQADLPDLPVMILSGRNGPSSLDWLQALPVSRYCFKPLSPAELAEQVSCLLRIHSAYRLGACECGEVSVHGLT